MPIIVPGKLRCFDDSYSNGVAEIVTNKETWVHSLEPESKHPVVAQRTPEMTHFHRSVAEIEALGSKRQQLCSVQMPATRRTVTVVEWRTKTRHLLLRHGNAPARRAQVRKNPLAWERINSFDTCSIHLTISASGSGECNSI